MAELIEFETERLRLRQWLPTDREPLAALNADPRVMEFFPSVLERAASDALADRCESLIAERGWGFWAAEVKESNQFIGFVGLNVPVAELPFSPCVEIGWRLACQYWGQGYATEAAKRVLRAGFEDINLPEIVSFTSLRNIRSQSVMERIGMFKTAENFEHPLVPVGNLLREHCLYRLSRAQWRMQEIPSTAFNK
jgi:RimJ/RimL family protein N-acetyltransferase